MCEWEVQKAAKTFTLLKHVEKLGVTTILFICHLLSDLCNDIALRRGLADRWKSAIFAPGDRPLIPDPLGRELEVAIVADLPLMLPREGCSCSTEV